jgi:hypothetical protein
MQRTFIRRLATTIYGLAGFVDQQNLLCMQFTFVRTAWSNGEAQWLVLNNST